jgi:hypothetical protein
VGRVFSLQWGAATAFAVLRLDLEGLAPFFRRDQGSDVVLVAGSAGRFRPEGGGGGRYLAFTAGGSDEGGLEELADLWFSLCSTSAIRFAKATMTVRIGAWASDRIVTQRDSRIEG